MQSLTTFSGEVVRVWASDPESSGKKAMARVTLKWREYSGTGPDGVARFRDAQVCLVGWEKRAASLAKLKKGERIVAEGKCQAGEPYQSQSNSKWYANQECHVVNWEPMVVSGLAAGDTSTEAESSEEEGPVGDEDQFAF
jgi:hypothetical protein